MKEAKLILASSAGGESSGGGSGGASMYRLSVDHVMRVARRVFPNKPEASFTKLQKVSYCPMQRNTNISLLTKHTYALSLVSLTFCLIFHHRL